MWKWVGTIALVMAGCGTKDDAKPTPAPPVAEAVVAQPATPNELLALGTPTFVAGTAGDDRADRAVRAQIELIRGLLFPDAPVVDDTEVLADGWPPRPIVYGGPHVNAAVATLALPFELDAERLALGGQVFEGEGTFLITVVPASADHPAFLLYAGTGTPGVGEINGVSHGADGILVADVFGPIARGLWKAGKAELAPRARRIDWRTVERPLAQAGAVVRVRFPAQLPQSPDEPAMVAAILRGFSTAVVKLGLAKPVSTTVYVYPDRASKESLTGNAGDGHAMVEARALHVVAFPPDAIEPLIAHEATHVLAYEGWGPAGTSLLGEGLAVWVSGRYGGMRLEQWRATMPSAPPFADLLGSGFRAQPENKTYPVAGLLVQAAVDRVGIAAVREHLFGATPAAWERAARAAGTTMADLQAAIAP